MNDHSSGWSPDSGDDDFENRPQRPTLERIFMDRARIAAEKDRERGPRRPLQNAIALVAAIALVLIIGFGFDAFLTSMQKVMRMLDEEEARQEQAAPRPEEPIPAYVVPSN